MMARSPHHASRRPRRRGLSLAETLISVVVVAVMLPAVLSTVVAAKSGQAHTVDRKLGRMLAESLMTEILIRNYEDPDGSVFGPEADEGTSSRADFDDIDDYHEWSASPPQNKDGTEIPERDNWGRSVEVASVLINDLQQTSAGETGVKRITVRVTHNDIEVASLVAIRTAAMDKAKTPD
jgi:hypothetical protein